MNSVNIIGRLTADIELRYTQSQKAVAQFTVAVDGLNKTDFIRCEAWEKNAENMNQYLHKGSQVGISGRLSSGSYEKNGVKVYTQNVICDRVDFLDPKPKDEEEPQEQQIDFAQVEGDVPF